MNRSNVQYPKKDSSLLAQSAYIDISMQWSGQSPGL